MQTENKDCMQNAPDSTAVFKPDIRIFNTLFPGYFLQDDDKSLIPCYISENIHFFNVFDISYETSTFIH